MHSISEVCSLQHYSTRDRRGTGREVHQHVKEPTRRKTHQVFESTAAHLLASAFPLLKSACKRRRSKTRDRLHLPSCRRVLVLGRPGARPAACCPTSRSTTAMSPTSRVTARPVYSVVAASEGTTSPGSLFPSSLTTKRETHPYLFLSTNSRGSGSFSLSPSQQVHQW